MYSCKQVLKSFRQGIETVNAVQAYAAIIDATVTAVDKNVKNNRRMTIRDISEQTKLSNRHYTQTFTNICITTKSAHSGFQRYTRMTKWRGGYPRILASHSLRIRPNSFCKAYCSVWWNVVTLLDGRNHEHEYAMEASVVPTTWQIQDIVLCWEGDAHFLFDSLESMLLEFLPPKTTNHCRRILRHTVTTAYVHKVNTCMSSVGTSHSPSR